MQNAQLGASSIPSSSFPPWESGICRAVLRDKNARVRSFDIRAASASELLESGPLASEPRFGWKVVANKKENEGASQELSAVSFESYFFAPSFPLPADLLLCVLAW